MSVDADSMDFSDPDFGFSDPTVQPIDAGYGSFTPSSDGSTSGFNPNSTAATTAATAAPSSGLNQSYLNLINQELAADPTGANAAASFGSSGSSGKSGSSGTQAASAGALSAILKALGIGGGNSSSAGINALAGLLGAAGAYSQNKAYSPTFSPPALFGGTSGSTGSPSASSGSTGYGPAGGYNYANYKGLTAGSAGTGYAPQTQINPGIPNYYTYGQQPQASFFKTMKRGGHVSTPQRFDAGGFAGQPNTGMMPPSQGPQSMFGGNATATPSPEANLRQPPQTGLPANPSAQNGLSALFSGNMAAPTASATPQVRPVAQPPQTGLPPNPVAGQNPLGLLEKGHMSTPGTPIGGSVQPTPQIRSVPAPTQQSPMSLPPRPQIGNQMRPPQQAPTFRPSMGNMPMRGRAMASGGSTSENTATSSVLTGQGPNLSSFMQNVRKAGTPSTKPLPSGGMAEGGPLANVSRHIKGPGDGTSDDIPARLANGEYVIDAQTVSMAGNGDNGAGAKALDKFRENLRQHKGKALAKGKMAPDAKPLEKYMPKGK